MGMEVDGSSEGFEVIGFTSLLLQKRRTTFSMTMNLGPNSLIRSGQWFGNKTMGHDLSYLKLRLFCLAALDFFS